MIQDIYPHKLDNQYRPEAKPVDESFIIVMKDGILAKTTGGETPYPRYSEMKNLQKVNYLFSIDDDMYFYAEDDEIEVPEGYEYSKIRALRADKSIPKVQIFAAFTAKHIINWYQHNKYCGCCGKLTGRSESERAVTCECGNTVYPRIMPAVIVGVTNGDQLLMTKYKRGISYYALVAGFTEIGETLEECVAREVMEETGIKVKNIRYYKSQPWGVADDLLAGFYCDVDGDTTITRDDVELAVAEWVKREDIELQPDQYSLTNEMMTMFKEGKEPR